MTDRLPRCRKLNRLGNRCPNPELEPTGLCGHHLAQAHRDYIDTITAAREAAERHAS